LEALVKKTKLSGAQIVGVLKKLDGGTPATIIAGGWACNTIRAWRDKYGGLRIAQRVRP